MRNITYNLVLNKHAKPQTKAEFGAFLAGLIDADGSIKKYGHVQITFHKRDVCIAYYIKTMVGNGYIYAFKKVPAYNYICSKEQGLKVIGFIISKNLKNIDKIKQFNSRLAPRLNSKFCKAPSFTDIQQNHWFAGFVQGDGSFQIKIRKPRKPGWSNQIEIVLQIELKHEDLLKQIQANFGGSIGYRKTRNTYYYSSVNLQNAVKLVNYFDKYQVMGPSYRLYLCWKSRDSVD